MPSATLFLSLSLSLSLGNADMTTATTTRMTCYRYIAAHPNICQRLLIVQSVLFCSISVEALAAGLLLVANTAAWDKTSAAIVVVWGRGF